MRRRRWFVSLGILSGFLLLVAIGLTIAVKRVPSFYEQSARPEGVERERDSLEATNRINAMENLDIDDQRWKVGFTGDQLNAWFQQDFVQPNGEENLPNGLHEPRVKFEDGKMRMGVRYGQGLFSTILAVELKLWLVPMQSNVVALEIVSLHAGSLPLSSGLLLDDISDAARRQNIDITWYRRAGHPVAILRFQADLTRPTLQFSSLELKNGSLTLEGESTLLTGSGRAVRK